ncbi:MAG: hypothetical protein M1824_000325 [Vezdaea acicularis]|nr:MAG: hypothetical protein M1824_000325 [Vezdaea acicularis]
MEMSAEDALTDDYVASLLAKDAKESSIKYSAMGLQAFLPQRSPSGAPKPNIRFLRNIIRETDTHNVNLRAKEEREACTRRLALEKRDRAQAEAESSRSRRRRDNEPQSKRRRVEEPVEERRRRSHRRERDSSRTDDEVEPRRSHHRHSRSHRSRERRRHGSPRRSQRSRRASVDERSENDNDERRHRSHHKHRRRSRSPIPPKSKLAHHRSRSHSPPPKPTRTRTRSPSSTPSDPLEAIVGPLPSTHPPPRGRGTITAPNRGINSRFSPSYNPAHDTDAPSPSTEKAEDWDAALEAYRDRQKWKAKGAERLREAGWADEVVGTWEKGVLGKGLRAGARTGGDGGGEGNIEDVKWVKRGEGREWDRGKVVGEDGAVDIKATWARDRTPT